MIKDLNDIRKHYEVLTPKIYTSHAHRWVSPYGWISNWPDLMTPIEFQTWQAIRTYGQIPLYPQYPVGKYFTDFANPNLGVAIECDGKEFHQDKEKDLKRDEDLFSMGYVVYRISGSDCFKTPSDDYYNIASFDNEREKYDILRTFYENTVEGLLMSLAWFFLFKQPFCNSADEKQLMRECLNKHVSLKDKVSHPFTEYHH